MADPLPLDSDLPDTTGISEEDRLDISAQIDRVAQQNRIQVGPGLFVLHPRKKGLMVPLAVNLGALVVLLAGLSTLWFLFRQGADNLVQNQIVLQTTEGKLIEELKKQSESELLAKDQQIADIQKRMVTLAQQKNDLQATMDDKIAAKEAELKQQLQQALEAERVRLTQAGYSQAVVEERLKAFEKQKNAEFEKQLADFKQKAEAERQGLENNLKKQQDDYQKNLIGLAGERQRILDDSRKRQNELQVQLDQKSQDLEAQKTASRAQLAQAQQVLRDLNDEKTKTESVQNQLLGLYTKVALAIQSRQFPDALTQVQGLVSFLNEPTVKALPDIQRRRDADLLLAATLTDWLTQDQKRLDADAARVQTTQSSLDTIQTLTTQADQALAAGKAGEAEALYTKALAQVPTVLEAHQYFLDKAVKAEQGKQAAVTTALATGDSALAAGKTADALAAYNSALDVLLPGQKTTFASHWGQAHFDTELSVRQASVDDASKRDLAAAQDLTKSGQSVQALAAYVAILSKYPVGEVGLASLTGIRQAGAGLTGPSPKETTLTAELTRVTADLKKAQTDAENAQKQLAAAQAQLAKAPAPAVASTNTGADPAALKAAQDEAAQFKPDAAKLGAMRTNFQAFLTSDAPLWKGTPGSAQVLQSKLLLNAFLGTPEVASTLPGLDTIVGRYEKSFLEAGQKEGLINVNDAVANLSQLSSPAERKQYLTTLQRRYADDASMTSVLKGLAALF